MPIYDTSPTVEPGAPIFRIVPCKGWVVRERIDAHHELERHADGTERIIVVIRCNTRTD